MGDAEYNSLLRLKEALEGAQKNTNRMLSRLEKFETRLSDIDEKMKPIQVTTGRYMKAKNNITETLQEVGKTYDYFRVANDVRETITRGYVANNQKEFLEAFKKLSQAKIFFQEHKEIKSAQSVLSSLESLLQTATSTCSQEFEKLLSQSGKSVDKLANTHYDQAPPFPTDIAKDIKTLCEAFDSSKYIGYYSQYQTSRIQRIRGDLKELETSQGALWNSLQGEDPYQRNNLPFTEMIALAAALLRGEYQLWTSLLPMNEESMSVFISICDALVAELQRLFSPLLSDKATKSLPGSTQVIRQSKMLLVRLDLFDAFNARYDELRDICHPDARHESTASLAVKNMRSMIVEAGIHCVSFLTSASIAEGFSMTKKSTVVGGLVAGHQHNAAHDDGIDNLACDLHPVTGNLLYLAKELVSNDYSTFFRRMIDVAHADRNLADDPVLSMYVEADEAVLALLDHLLTAMEVRAEKFDEQIKSKASGRRSLAVNHHALYDFEDKVAEECVQSARKHLFLINNIFATATFAKDRRRDIQGSGGGGGSSSGSGGSTANSKPPASLTVRAGGGNSGNSGGGGGSSGLSAPMSSAAKSGRISRLSNFIDRVEARLKTEQEMFCETIALALGLSAQDMMEFQHAYDKDKANQSRLLKAKFSMFNTGMDAFLAQQGEWRVSSAALRDVLAQQLTQRILSTYATFFATYSAIKFSKKHMNEYLKYTPAQLELHLRSFFGRST